MNKKLKIKSVPNRTKENNMYAKIPNEIIGFGKTNPVVIPVYIYLIRNRTVEYNVLFSINDIVTSCGYTPNTHKGMSNNIVITILDTLENMGYFNLVDGKYSSNSLCKCKLNKELFNVSGNYGTVSYSEVDLIYNYCIENKTGLTIQRVLLVLAYIRKNKIKNSNEGNTKSYSPEFYYCYISKMSEILNISCCTIEKCISILSNLNIIACKSLYRYKDSYGNWHTNVTIFVDKTLGFEKELKKAERYLKNNYKDYHVEEQFENNDTE